MAELPIAFAPDLHPRTFVAGHRGLLGSAVTRNLAARGFANVLTRTSQELDLGDQTRTFEFFERERPEYVFLCAAKVGGIKANAVARGEFLYKNLAIQNNVMEAARRSGVKKLLFVGSSCIYPRDSVCPIKEDALLTGPFEPSNEGYALAKTAGVKMCEFYREQYGCDYVAALPTNLFGINDQYDPDKSHLLPALIRKVHFAKVEGRDEIEIWGTGTPRREFMLSDDCADALVFLMERYSSAAPINVGTGEDHTILELARAVSRVVFGQGRADLKLKIDPSKPDGMMRKVLDVGRLDLLGWRSRTSLDDGVAVAYKDFLSRV